jgi:regulator of nucleoside diphosphate kinase
MHDYTPTILSIGDYTRLQVLLSTMIGSRTPLAALVRRKLGSAVVMSAGELGPEVAMSGRAVRFVIDGGRTDERNLIWSPSKRDDGGLSLLVPRGLALLGLSVGHSISFQTDNRKTQTVRVERVSIDPDAPDDELEAWPEGSLPVDRASLPGFRYWQKPDLDGDEAARAGARSP